MSKLVILEIRDADNEQRYPVTLRIGDSINSMSVAIHGYLPPAQDLRKSYDHFNTCRRECNLGSSRKLEHINKGKIVNYSIKQLGDSLENNINSWLTFGDNYFQPIRDKIIEVLSHERGKEQGKGKVRFIIQTDDVDLWGLPWHLWDKFQQFEVEPVISNFQAISNTQLIKSQHTIRILVILGSSIGINTDADLVLLKESIVDLNAEITTKVAINSTQLNQQLWEQNWDILFFAGHSSSKYDYSHGMLDLSETESISIKDLKYGLENAIKHGLKLAIFNSCDGMGLVNELASLQIPAVIAMRERVPDEVAQKFLEHFLQAFARERKSLPDSVMDARKKLHGMEGEYPFASWLPMIYEHLGVEPPTWDELLKGNEEEWQRVSIWRNLRTVLVASVLVTGAVMGVRWLGLLEPLELPAYDYLMGQRQSEPIDSRITVVEISQEEVDKYGGYPIKESALAEIVNKVEKYKPAALGLNISRNQPRIKDNRDITARKNWIKSFQENQNFYTVCSYQSSAGDHAPPPEFSPKQLTEQVGFVDFFDDNIQDNKYQTVRRQLLSYDPNYLPKSSKCSTPYSFSFLLAFSFLSSQNRPLQVNENTKNWQLDRVIFNRLASHTGGYQSLDGNSSQILLNYRANPRPAKIVSLTDIVEGKVGESAIKGRVVIVGYTAGVARDDFNTPYGPMPAVWIHAHMTSQILSAVMDNPKRPLLWDLPKWGHLQWGDAVFVWLWALTGGVLVIYVRPRLYLTIVTCAASLLLYYICLAILNQGGWMPLVPSALALVATGSGLVIYKISKNRQPE
ncbi:CHASE2 domain-containing protein [Microcoleus sp. CAWBG640]|uniref:CHASE2 domain-containing protein n=1 Tax=Microcoleus sp. CAWBG640 TaxID=2841653 RepID=UPI00312BC2BB